LPTVVEEARNFFDCATLPGPELENQPTSECVIYGSHWEQRTLNGELMASSDDSDGYAFISRITLALLQDSGWYRANMSRADYLVKGVHWGYGQGCAFATKKCISDDGKPVWDRAFCTDEHHTACALDRLGEHMCEADRYKNVPNVFQYQVDGGFVLGEHAQSDYCPTYRIKLTNRRCVDASTAVTVPWSNPNYMREVFGPTSRCFDKSTLRAPVQEAGGRSRSPDDLAFRAPRAVCYEVDCDATGDFYGVWIADLEGGGRRLLGNCSQEGQELTHADFDGSLVCVPVQEVCHLKASVLGGASPIAGSGRLGDESAESSSPYSARHYDSQSVETEDDISGGPSAARAGLRYLLLTFCWAFIGASSW